jgi:hypothetical protein
MTEKFGAVIDQKPDQPDKIKPCEYLQGFSRGFSFWGDQTVAENRLISATKPGMTASFTYDGDGNRYLNVF